jgi:formate/nitrite transporter FocA (FNT family)
MADESPRRQREEGTALSPASKLPGLSGEERRAVEEKSRPNAPLIHETIRAEGESELERTAHALLLSGLAAGLSMGFSLVVQGLLQSRLPDAPWRELVANLGYTVGFLIVVLGRQQLFTENTLTPILPLLHNRDGETLWRVLRLWGLVLAANVAGTYAFAVAAAHTGAFGPEAKAAFAEISRHAIEGPFGTTFVKAVFAGWLIALMVWLLPAAEGAGSIVVIVVVTYVVALPPRDYLVRFFAPTLLGNVVGGVALVAVLNYGQVAPELED